MILSKLLDDIQKVFCGEIFLQLWAGIFANCLYLLLILANWASICAFSRQLATGHPGSSGLLVWQGSGQSFRDLLLSLLIQSVAQNLAQSVNRHSAGRYYHPGNTTAASHCLAPAGSGGRSGGWTRAAHHIPDEPSARMRAVSSRLLGRRTRTWPGCSRPFSNRAPKGRRGARRGLIVS